MGSHGEVANRLLAQVDLVDLTDEVLERALSPFPVALRTLDALHVATFEYLRQAKLVRELATYDRKLIDAAKHLKIPLKALAH
jgi:predicted nucleic acid-binding protein